MFASGGTSDRCPRAKRADRFYLQNYQYQLRLKMMRSFCRALVGSKDCYLIQECHSLSKFSWYKRSASLACVLLGLASGKPVISQTRIPNAISNQERVTVKATSPNLLLAKSKDTGRLSGNQRLGRMVLLLAPTPEQESAAAQLVADQNDASSLNFHKWMSPTGFGTQFGVADEDTAQVKQWLLSQGLTVHAISNSRRFIVFSGNVSQVENAFSTQMHSYTYNDKAFVSNSTDIQIPAALRQVVKGVVRLHSDPVAPSVVLGKKVPFQKKNGQFTFGDGSHYMAPADFAKIYNVQPLYDAGIDGTGQTIAIVGRSNIDLQNVRDFRSNLGLPANDPEVIVNGDDPGQTSDMVEAMLDVTWSGAVAPKAHIKFVVSQSNFTDGVDVSAEYIVDNNLAPVMSTSYGSCEADLGPVENAFYNSLWQQAAAEGITSFVSSGDNGGAGCDLPGGGYYSSGTFGVNGIASTPYNVAVGGTQFDEGGDPSKYWSETTDPTTGQSALGYIPEVVWNESSNDPNYVSLYAGSGGVSSIYKKPSWQAGAGVPNDGMRDIPDISFSAALHDGYLICLFSSCSYGNYFYSAGGTSVSSPAAAGMMALVNQKMGGLPQGMANYVFYKLANVPGVYHDTTNGNNKVPGPNGQFTVGYNAAPSYDLATGLGSMDVNALVNNWQAAASGSNSKVTLKLKNGQSATVIHGTPIGFRAKVSCDGTASCATATGTVALSAASSSASTVAVGSGALTPSASGSIVDILSTTVPGGSYTVSARYSGDGKYNSSTSASIPVLVTPESSETFVGSLGGGYTVNAPITLQYGLHWQVAIAVAGKSGNGYPTGQMALTADGQPIQTGSYDPGTGNVNPNSLTLNYGEKAVLENGVPPTSQSSTVSYVLPSEALGAGVHTLVASYPGDPSFAPSQGAYSYNVTQAQGQIQDFFAAGSVIANAPVKFIAQIGFDNNGWAPYGGTATLTDITGPTPIVLGTAPVNSQLYGGYWELVVNIKTPGTHILKLNFTGDKNVKGVVGTYTVPFAGTSDSYLAVGTDVTNTFAGQPVTITANVSSDVTLYMAKGSVTFLNGTTPIGTAPLDATGTAVLTTKALPAGVNNISANYAGDGVLNPSVSGPVTETVSDYLVQSLPSTLTIKNGDSGSATLNLIPLGGFAQVVNLTCANLPATISCKFTPAKISLDGTNPGTATLVINTKGFNSSELKKTGLWAIPSGAALAGLLILPLGRRRKLQSLVAAVALMVVAVGGIGCGSPTADSMANSNKSKNVGTYNIHVTTTSVTGTTPKTSVIVLNVTQ
jgi:Pro-kumamolisin, activation domain/Bacterial Ig-like domain (group 3)